jgi:hypothetical protein
VIFPVIDQKPVDKYFPIKVASTPSKVYSEVMQIDIEPKPEPVKGSLVGVQVFSNFIELWYSSPTGDSTDSVIHKIMCLDEAQAESLAQLHRVTWGLALPD